MSGPYAGSAPEPQPAADPVTTVIRGAVVGAAVAAAFLLLWLPTERCSSEGFECLGQAVLVLLGLPLVATVVAFLVGALVRLPRWWLVALVGPFAGYGVLRTAFAFRGAGLSPALVSAVGIVLAYALVAWAVRPGGTTFQRVVVGMLVAAGVVLPSLLVG